MNNEQQLKELVKQTYSDIALQEKKQNQSSCCGATSTTCCGDDVYSIMSDDYSKLEGYNSDSDLGLGCGLPTKYANIKEGDTVIDLGSGAGNDAFVARKIVGNNGRVIGIDFTEAMIEKARTNLDKLGYNNIEFRQGDIESLPVTFNRADVVISNCVVNLIPNKHKVFSEIYRVLKPGAHFSISDIVLEGELPEKWQAVAEMYAGCISGAIQKKDYLGIIEEAGFVNSKVQKEKTITLPDEILKNYFSDEEINSYKSSSTSVKSITVYAEKPAKDDRNCCEPGSACC